MDTVMKHGSHDQKTHGRGGGAREVSAKDVDSAWDAVLSDEARTIDNPKKAHPERYDSKGKLKDGEVETRRVQGEGPPRVRDYETNESAGLSWSEAAKVEGALGLSQTGDFTMRVPIGPERPPQHVYRVMSTEEFDQARQRGYIKSDERMNLASGEGTVTSLRSTGDFYAPVDGSDYRIVRIKYDDADGWRTDTIDSYIKTQERVPFDRVDLYSSPLTNPRVVKHGSHNQKDHGRGKGGGTLRNQDEPMDPETAWVHSTTWYHGTSRPDLVTLDARNAPSRYPNMGSSYSLMAHNFATNDRELAAQYARDAVDMDMKNGITGARAVVYEVKPTSDYFDPDPHSGPGGWNDGPEDMSVAFDLVDGGGSVSIRFHDEMDIVGAFDADTGEPITVQKMAEMLKHGSHDQSSHGRKGGSSRAEPVRSMSEMPPNIRRVAESFDAPTWSRFRDSCDQGGGCEDVAAAIEDRFGIPQVTGTFTTRGGAKEYHSWNQDESGWIVDGGQDVFPSGQGDGSALMFFPPGASQYAADSVAKHGSHNQSSHNPHKGGAADLPEGWSAQSRESVVARFEKQALEGQGQTPEKAREFGERKADLNDYYDGPNGSVVCFEKSHNISETARDRLLNQVAEMQQVAPVPGMEVTVGLNAYRYYGEDPRSVGGFAMLGKPQIFLAPRSVTTGFKNDPEWLMPSIRGNTKKYPLAHEWGHTIDRRSNTNAYDDWVAVSKLSGMSKYGRSDARESFAEAFVDWHLTGGRTTSEAVGYYRDKYNWGSEGGVTVAKAAQAVTIVADTFGPEGATVREMTPPDPVEWELAQPVTKAVYVAFEPGLRPVLKHGSHDQSSHGRRGGGGSSLTLDAGVAQSIVERVRANGGLSVSMVDGSEPTGGYMVAKGGKQSAIVDADEFYDPVKGPAAMSSFLKENRELGEGSYLGLWHNQADGKVYFDVSENIMDRATAIQAGRDRDQISIWDVANLEEINTGGTGQVGKAVAGSETAGPVQDDGSGDRRVRKESVGEGGGAVVVAFEPGLRPVLKHGSHDQSSHGRRGGGGGDAASAIEQLRGVPGRYTPPGGGTMRGQNFDTDEPKSRRSAGKTWQEEYEEQREAIAQALVTGDYSNLGLPDSPLASSLGSAVGRVERRIARVAERVGIRRKKRWQFTEEQATRLRESYYERYGRPSWMGKAFKIIRKHLGGAHDQKSHGRGGGGKSGWGDRQKDIDAMASAGPSRYALETAVGGGISDDEVRERIAEDFSESIEEQAREAVQQSMDDEGWVDVTTLDESDPRYDPDGPLMGPTYQEEFESRMAQARDEITESYVYDYGDEYRNQAQADAGIDPDTFNEVYGVTHVGVNADGVEVTMTAQVENVYVDPYGDGIVVSGNVYDQDGNIATSDSWERKIYMENGELVAENALLTLEPEYRGLGFAKTFNTTAENYYISHGIDKVNVHAALDVGGYAWAKQGFDWAPKGGATWTVKGQFDDVLSDPSLPASVRRSGVELRARLDLPNYDRDYPTPREVASWGYVQGASTWPGKQALLGSDWYGQKRLTPSGPRLSTTQQEAANQPAAAPELPGQMTLPGVVS